jgi:hypothetical protein
VAPTQISGLLWDKAFVVSRALVYGRTWTGRAKAMSEFAAFSSYTGGSRGATWQIGWSDDNVTWTTVATLNYTTCSNCAAEAANGFGGWYRVTFTP